MLFYKINKLFYKFITKVLTVETFLPVFNILTYSEFWIR